MKTDEILLLTELVLVEASSTTREERADVEVLALSKLSARAGLVLSAASRSRRGAKATPSVEHTSARRRRRHAFSLGGPPQPARARRL